MNVDLSRRCIEALGRAPAVMASAPGRVNLIGDHIDYCGGPVLPMAIENRTAVAVVPAEGPVSTLVAEDLGERVSIQLGSHCEVEDVPPGFARHVVGCIEQLRRFGMEVRELDLAITSDVPIGAGLASSAALEVATLLAVSAMHDVQIDPMRLVTMARNAEHRYVGTPCGIMDMLVAKQARVGQASLIDTVSLATEYIAMPAPEQAVVLVVDTGTRHDLAIGHYARRRADAETAARLLGLAHLARMDPASLVELPEKLRPLARHVCSEVARVHDAADALRAGDLQAMGTAMSASHASLRDDCRVSCPELDAVVGALVEKDGVFGARMTGGGFGGCVVALVHPDGVPDLGAAAVDAVESPARWWTSTAGPAGCLEH